MLGALLVRREGLVKLRKHVEGLFEVMACFIHLSMYLGFSFKDLTLNLLSAGTLLIKPIVTHVFNQDLILVQLLTCLPFF